MVDDVDYVLVVGREPRPRMHYDPVVVRRQQTVQFRVVQCALRLVVHERSEHIAACLQRLSVVGCGRVALLRRANGRAAAVHVFADGIFTRGYFVDDFGPVDAGGGVGVGEPNTVALEER